MIDFPILLYTSTSEIPTLFERTLPLYSSLYAVPNTQVVAWSIITEKRNENEQGEQDIYRLRQKFPRIRPREPAQRLGNWKMETKQKMGSGVINYRAKTSKK